MLARELCRLPEGVDVFDLYPEQKLFVLYAMAAMPPLQDLSLHLRQQREEDELKKRPAASFLQKRSGIQRETDNATAASRGITLAELYREMGEKIRAEEIKNLHKRYGINNESENSEKLRDRAELLTQRITSPEYPDLPPENE